MDSRHDLQLMSSEEKIQFYTERSHKMFTFLRGVCSDGLHPNTRNALGYARDKHERENTNDKSCLFHTFKSFRFGVLSKIPPIVRSAVFFTADIMGFLCPHNI